MKKTLDLAVHCRRLYKISYYMGFLPYKYNPSTCRLQESIFGTFIARIMHSILEFISAIILFILFCFAMMYYFNVITINTPWCSTVSQDAFLESGSTRSIILLTFIISRSFINLEDMIMPTVNEMLQIYELIMHASKTDRTIHCPRIFKANVNIKLFMSIWRLIVSQYDVRKSLLVHVYLQPYSFLSNVLYILLSFAHFYSKLVLINFYIRMIQFLTHYSHKMTPRQRTISVERIISITHKISRVKSKLDTFFSGLFLATYFLLFGDIKSLYDLMKKLMYPDFLNDEPYLKSRYPLFLAIVLPDLFNASFEIYCISQLSDVLVNCQRILQRQVIVFLCKKKLLRKKKYRIERQIDLMLLQSKVNGAATMAFEQIVFDKEFSFDFTFNLVIPYAIVFLQFFASEVVYAV